MQREFYNWLLKEVTQRKCQALGAECSWVVCKGQHPGFMLFLAVLVMAYEVSNAFMYFSY